jgi:hypothetical protein
MKTVAQLIRDSRMLVETMIPEPTIEIKKTLSKNMRLIFINGEQAGVLHHEPHSLRVGFDKYRKVPLWSGEFTFRDEKIWVGRTEKTSELLPKVARLVRGVIVRQSTQESPVVP